MLDTLLHLDDHLRQLIVDFGGWVYLILFCTVFCETGLIIIPFLPGDTLLFAAGIFAHGEEGGLNYWILFLVFTTAALAGDNVNYQVGRVLGQRLFSNPNSRVFRRENLEKTHAFFEHYGPKAIILARFLPIFRTFVPFAAGMGTMTYRKFISYSIVGALLWVGVCLTAGYWFGQIPVVRNNFGAAVLGIVGVTLIPVIIEWMKHKRQTKSASSGSKQDSASDPTNP